MSSGSPPQSRTSQARTAHGPGPWVHALLARPEAGAAGVLVLLVIALSFLSPQFLTAGNLMLVARSFSFTAIAALGACLVILTSGIDLSVGSVMGLAGVSAGLLAASTGNTALGIVVGLALAAVVGLLNGFLSAFVGLAPFMVTLGMLSVVRGSIVGITGGMPVQGFTEPLLFLGQGYWLGVPVPVWIMIVLAVLMAWVLRSTKLGWYIYSIGGNEEASRLSGVRVVRVKIAVFTLAGLLAGVGGILMTSRLGVGESTAGVGYELDVIAAAVIGGTSLAGGKGNIVGVIWGAALMGVVRNGLVLLGVTAYWQQITVGAFIVLAVLIDRLRGGRT
ncbi:MAG: ABC transporter permease [Propioniciclava sp.]